MSPAAVLLISFLVPASAKAGTIAGPVAQARPAEVAIAPQPAGQRLLRLPGIDFPLRIAPKCPAGLGLQSLLVSIADTRRAFSAADFESGPVIDTLFRVAESQVGPVAVDRFCTDDAGLQPATLRIADAFTANVSLRCGNDAAQSVTYDTLALDVLLVCRTAPQEAAATEAPAVDPGKKVQDASSSAFRF